MLQATFQVDLELWLQRIMSRYEMPNLPDEDCFV
jgi:hypothetical protein